MWKIYVPELALQVSGGYKKQYRFQLNGTADTRGGESLTDLSFFEIETKCQRYCFKFHVKMIALVGSI